MKYGKLGQGVLVKVPCALVKRRKAHFFNLTIGASIILGCNGFIWISSVKGMAEEETEGGGYNIGFNVSSHFKVYLANLLSANNITLSSTGWLSKQCYIREVKFIIIMMAES
jgi:exosome complex RNA-binding protein Rrp4